MLHFFPFSPQQNAPKRSFVDGFWRASLEHKSPMKINASERLTWQDSLLSPSISILKPTFPGKLCSLFITHLKSIMLWSSVPPHRGRTKNKGKARNCSQKATYSPASSLGIASSFPGRGHKRAGKRASGTGVSQTSRQITHKEDQCMRSGFVSLTGTAVVAKVYMNTRYISSRLLFSVVRLDEMT